MSRSRIVLTYLVAFLIAQALVVLKQLALELASMLIVGAVVAAMYRKPATAA
jgi:hypothetical protein